MSEMKKLLKINYLIICVYSLFLTVFSLAGCINNDVTNNVNSILEHNSFFVNSVNHRGYYTAPENTLAAFRESRQNGFTMVECDVSFTKDGYAVLLHDNTVDRTSNGTGKINSLTLKEVRSLDFGSWKSPEYVGEKIPTFEEFIFLCRNISLHPYIEIKRGATTEQVKQLIKTVIKYGMQDNVTWVSFEESYLKSIIESYAYARVGYIVFCINEQIVKNAVELRTDKNNVFIDCYHADVNSDSVQLCINELLPLEVWTVDNKNDILNLDPYISGVTSNKLIASKVLYENTMN